MATVAGSDIDSDIGPREIIESAINELGCIADELRPHVSASWNDPDRDETLALLGAIHFARKVLVDALGGTTA